MSSNKMYSQRIIDAIIDGKLDLVKKLYLGKSDVNMHLQPYSNIKPKPKYTQESWSIMCPNGITPLMLAVLCEQDDIVKYLLTIKGIDLSIQASGFNALHLSIFSKDHKCFEILLKTDYYHYHINDPIDLQKIDGLSGQRKGNTLLHSAVSQRNYYAVYMLTKPLPSIEYRTLDIDEEDEMKYDEDDDYFSNVNAVALSGSTPLKIAVYQQDFKLISILLNGNANPNYPRNSPEEAENDPSTARGYLVSLLNRQESPSPVFNDILEAFDSYPDESGKVSDEIEKFLKENNLEDDLDMQDDDDEDYDKDDDNAYDDESDDGDDDEMISIRDVKTVKDLEKIEKYFNNIISEMKGLISSGDDISEKVKEFESVFGPGKTIKRKKEIKRDIDEDYDDDDDQDVVYGTESETRTHSCAMNCASTRTKECPICHMWFCQTHLSKHLNKEHQNK